MFIKWRYSLQSMDGCGIRKVRIGLTRKWEHLVGPLWRYRGGGGAESGYGNAMVEQHPGHVSVGESRVWSWESRENNSTSWSLGPANVDRSLLNSSHRICLDEVHNWTKNWYNIGGVSKSIDLPQLCFQSFYGAFLYCLSRYEIAGFPLRV